MRPNPYGVGLASQVTLSYETNLIVYNSLHIISIESSLVLELISDQNESDNVQSSNKQSKLYIIIVTIKINWCDS